MQPGDPGRGPGEASAAPSTPASGKMGSGETSRLSPPLLLSPTHTTHRLTRATPNRGSCRAPQSQAAHKAPPAHTQHSRSRRARPHNRTARTPPRPLVGVPASPAPGSALCAHPHPETQPERGEGGTVAARPLCPASRSKFAGRPPTHPHRCSAAGTAAPAATWRGRRSRCPAPSQPPRPRR